MARHTFDKPSLVVLHKALGTERNTLVDADAIADDARFANHHAGAVIDEESPADAGPGVDVDPRGAVSNLCDHSRQQGHAELREGMRNSEERERIDPRISEDR